MRGTRALHEFGEPTQHSTKRMPHFVVEKKLVAACWCDKRFVLVNRDVILDGSTGTCGRSTCHPPDGSPSATCVLVKQNGATWKPVDDTLLPRRHREVPTLADETADHSARRQRGTNADVRLRRDLVQLMWDENMAVNDIAEYLNVWPHIVKNDVQSLFNVGRIARRKRTPSAERKV